MAIMSAQAIVSIWTGIYIIILLYSNKSDSSYKMSGVEVRKCSSKFLKIVLLFLNLISQILGTCFMIDPFGLFKSSTFSLKDQLLITILFYGINLLGVSLVLLMYLV